MSTESTFFFFFFALVLKGGNVLANAETFFLGSYKKDTAKPNSLNCLYGVLIKN